jgi:chemotaxis protein histidine kinase CheA
MLANFKFKQFSLIMLIIYISHDISAMTYNEQNKNNASNLHRFLGDENLKVKKIIISLAINSFLKNEESEIIRINKEIHNNELEENYIKRYFKIKKSYYEDFFSDKDGKKYTYRMTPFTYFTSTTPSDFYARILINRLAENLVDKLEDAQFLVSYFTKQCQSDENFKDCEKEFDEWLEGKNITILPEAKLYEKSNKVLEERIKNLIKLYNIGSQESKFISIINYDLKGNNEPYENKLIKLFIENKLLFKCDREKIIKSNEINLNIIKISADELKNPFNFEDLHSKKNDLNIDYSEKFIIDLLLWFRDGQLEFKKNEEFANKNMEDLIEEEKIEKAEKEARRKKKKAKKEAQKAKKKAEQEALRKAEEEEANRKAKEEERRKAEQEAHRKAEQEAHRKAKEEASRKAEEEARRKAKEEASRKAEEEERRKAEEEYRKAEEEENRKAEEYRALLDSCLRLEGSIIGKIEAFFGKDYLIEVKDFESLIVIQQKVENNIKNMQYRSFSLNSEVNNYIIDLKGYE